ncbi:hypothetical protein [Amycolatopsis sp. FDAARGOS 1241]|uniref:hypothetical protein n=1 Tax=Amycolatopsis sp. FDAARGOS 1241 TaxID=2778070 RepID=UPI0019516789|nr:hypothetical protein [Amycolatopsis sp. FDAARGOS 1241]QRP47414.1 hypothetical protein I6J71_05450 [Amycolatopsis sp. FDAARGOS 1241]
MGTLSELSRLHLSRPVAGAGVAVVAAWQRRHAEVLEHLAAEGGAGTQAAVAAPVVRRRADGLAGEAGGC